MSNQPNNQIQLNRGEACVALVDRSGRRKNPQEPKFSQERTMEDHIGD